MENTTAGGPAGRQGSFGYCLAVALGCCVVPVAVHAQEAASTPLEMAAEASRTEPAMRMELTTSNPPRFEGTDSGSQGPRVDLSLLTPGGTGVGPMLGMTGVAPAPGLAPHSQAAPRPGMDLGVHFRHTLDSSRQFDVKAWKRLNAEPDAYTLIQQRQPVYGASVEMKLAPASRSPLRLDRGFIGMQLQSGARISIKRKDGKPMVYYRSSF